MTCRGCGYEKNPADALACGMCSAPLGPRAEAARAASTPAPREVGEAARVVRIEAKTVQMPRCCPCCLAAPETEFEVMALVEGKKRWEGGALLGRAVKDVRTARLTFPICRRCLRHARLDLTVSAVALLLGAGAFAAGVAWVYQDPEWAKAFTEGGGAALCIGLSAIAGALAVALVSAMLLGALLPKSRTCAATEYPVDADLPGIDSPVVIYKFTNGAYGARFKAANLGSSAAG